MAKKTSKIKASHILIMHNESKDSRSDISKEEAKKVIDEIHKKLVDKKERFVDLATKHSDCSSASYGGSLGEFGKGVMVKAFEDIVFSLKTDSFSEPFESEFGYHIAKRDK
mgnify:FL=1|tara:strand:+ start:318 stop:650 length:333 start_codon:yes stop_codon:yes gene_type:complete